jgi:hypothetical protein
VHVSFREKNAVAPRSQIARGTKVNKNELKSEAAPKWLKSRLAGAFYECAAAVSPYRYRVMALF